jgi:hypothetical protein
MATKNPSKKPSKSAFIRSLPPSTPGAEVVARGKAAGLKFNVNYVYRIRSLANGKRETRTSGSRKTVRPGRLGASVPRPISSTSSAENLLRALAAEVGLSHAIDMLEAERTRVRAVLRR